MSRARPPSNRKHNLNKALLSLRKVDHPDILLAYIEATPKQAEYRGKNMTWRLGLSRSPMNLRLRTRAQNPCVFIFTDSNPYNENNSVYREEHVKNVNSYLKTLTDYLNVNYQEFNSLIRQATETETTTCIEAFNSAFEAKSAQRQNPPPAFTAEQIFSALIQVNSPIADPNANFELSAPLEDPLSIGPIEPISVGSLLAEGESKDLNIDLPAPTTNPFECSTPLRSPAHSSSTLFWPGHPTTQNFSFEPAKEDDWRSKLGLGYGSGEED